MRERDYMLGNGQCWEGPLFEVIMQRERRMSSLKHSTDEDMRMPF